jgi:hypothetical protein
MSEQAHEVTVYNANITTLSALQKAAEEKYDAILTTLGSAFLALSVSFVKDVVPLAEAQWAWVLYLSWLSFAATIMVTVISLGMSSYAVAWHVRQLSPGAFAPEGLEKKNPWSRAIQRLNLFAGAAFLLGVLCTVVFAVSNTVHWRSNMEKRVPQSSEIEQRGLTIPAMQTGTTRPASSTGGTAPATPAPAPAQNSGSGSK